MFKSTLANTQEKNDKRYHDPGNLSLVVDKSSWIDGRRKKEKLSIGSVKFSA
jgi:hypothetical protein